jgi:hypothetical protein
MSSPIRPAKDLEALLMYAPPWAPEKLPVVSVAADERPVEQPPQSYGVDPMGPTFSEDLAPPWAREKLPVVSVAADERPVEQPPQSYGVDAMGPTFSEDLAPSWAREKLSVVPVAADERPIEQPPQSHGVHAMGPTFSEDLAAPDLRRRLSLNRGGAAPAIRGRSISGALDRDTDRVNEALDELRRAAGLDAHRGFTFAEKRGLVSDAEEGIGQDTRRELVNPIPDVPIEYEEEIPFQHYGGPASYWSALLPRSWIGIMMRFVGVAAVAAVLALLVGISSWNLATNGQLEKRPFAASGLSEPSKSEGFDGTIIASERPASSAPEHAVDKQPPERPGESTFVSAPSRVTIEGFAMSERAPPSATRAQEAAPPTAQTTAPSVITRQLDRDEIAALLKRGEDFITSGDLASARLVLQRAAEAGDMHAALTLAAAFDPNLLAKLGRDLPADVVKARFWYERAKQLGSTEAPRRLERLASQANSVP